MIIIIMKIISNTMIITIIPTLQGLDVSEILYTVQVITILIIPICTGMITIHTHGEQAFM